MEMIFYNDLAKYGLQYSRPHLWKLERQGKFPQHVKIGANRVAWLKSEIEQFLADRIAERGKRQPDIAA